MADKDIMLAGAHKVSSIIVHMKGVAGAIETFTNVKSWRLGYNGILTIDGDKWTEILSEDQWDRITVSEE